MQPLDKEFEVEVEAAFCLLRFHCSEESVGSPNKATRQLCTASKSVLAWTIAFRAMWAIRAHADTSDGGEDCTYLHEKCIGATKWIFSLNSTSQIISRHVDMKEMIFGCLQLWAISCNPRPLVSGSLVGKVGVNRTVPAQSNC